MSSTKTLRELTGQEYKYGFVTDVETDTVLESRVGGVGRVRKGPADLGVGGLAVWSAPGFDQLAHIDEQGTGDEDVPVEPDPVHAFPDFGHGQGGADNPARVLELRIVDLRRDRYVEQALVVAHRPQLLPDGDHSLP